MPVLSNPKHERFAQELAKGKTATEAYELAGYKPNRGNAATLKQDQSISGRIAELLAEREDVHAQATAQAIDRTGLTKQWVLDRLINNALIANGEKTVKLKIKPRDSTEPVEIEMSMRDAQAANRALELLGKELGMFVDRREVGEPGEFERLDEAELLDAIRQYAEETGLSIEEIETATQH